MKERKAERDSIVESGMFRTNPKLSLNFCSENQVRNRNF